MLLLAVDAALAATPEAPRYAVTFDATSHMATVRLCLAQAHDAVRIAADSDWAMHFVSGIARSSGAAVDKGQEGWRAARWQAGECLSYAADIGAIASANKVDVGWQMGEDLVAAPQLWLLRVEDTEGDAHVEIALPPGWAVSAPWREEQLRSALPPGTSASAQPHAGAVPTAMPPPSASLGSTASFTIPHTPADWSAAVAIGHFTEERITLPGGVLRLTILHGGDVTQRATLRKWFDHVSQAILSAYGRLPLPDVQVLMIPVDGHGHGGVLFGQSVRGEGNSLQLLVDPSRPAEEFDDDWMAVHELSHLMHPYLGDRGAWLAEGLATYYQNVLRARAGMLTPAQAWGRLAEGFKRGASGQSADTLEDAAEHMHRTHAFQRVYWSGAAFWLTVDNDLRRTSGDKIGLDAVLGKFGACCLPAYREWRPEEFVARIDALAGTTLIEERYREFAARREFPDWTAVFADLGIDSDGSQEPNVPAVRHERRDAIMRAAHK